MAEAIAAVSLASNIFDIIQATDRVIDLSKYYLKAVENAPSDLRLILVEISSVRSILQNLQFLSSCDVVSAMSLEKLGISGGPIDGCRKAITELEKLLPPESSTCLTETFRRRRVETVWTVLKWPLKEKKAKILLEEISEYKATINLALTAETM
jgi:hypothetical protein